MKEKVKCKKCKLLIDADSKTCPYCGYDQSLEPETKKETLEQEQTKAKDFEQLYFHRKEGAFSLSIKRHLYLILTSIIGLQLIVLLLSVIFKATNATETLGIDKVNTLTTLIAYPILLVSLCLVLWTDFIPVIKTFKYWKNFIYGLGFAALLIGFSIAYNAIITACGVATNENQHAVESSITIYPAAAIIVLGFVGPICEELSYRLGLYGIIRKRNFWLALCISSLIFGLIHFNFAATSKDALITELINLPSYIICGAILCLAYEFGGLASSITAHVINNVIATIIVLS